MFSFQIYIPTRNFPIVNGIAEKLGQLSEIYTQNRFPDCMMATL
ncbi:hypothetical protein VHA_001076 [Grimontia hollisae CIP 101886]|uniref:Uncharacterized protein n=1 Tax=Grimontia hollisae CIP 101886 TaxID=675812 RepID=D0I5Q9_GRIHO|nr:hypothetical protein VHA_001076 [Grimontia hollisae CIP 101886]